MNNFAKERVKIALSIVVHRVYFLLQSDFSNLKHAKCSVEKSGEGKLQPRLESLGTISAMQDKGLILREIMMQC